MFFFPLGQGCVGQRETYLRRFFLISYNLAVGSGARLFSANTHTLSLSLVLQEYLFFHHTERREPEKEKQKGREQERESDRPILYRNGKRSRRGERLKRWTNLPDEITHKPMKITHLPSPGIILTQSSRQCHYRQHPHSHHTQCKPASHTNLVIFSTAWWRMLLARGRARGGFDLQIASLASWFTTG